MIKNGSVSRKKLNIFFAVCVAVLYCIYCFALIPLWKMYANDVLYMDTVLPEIVEYAYDLVELAVIALAYAVSVYSVYSYGLGGTWISALIFGVGTLFKYAVNLCATWLDIGFDADSLLSDISSVALPMLLELLQYFIVLLIAYRILSKYREHIKKREKAARARGEEPAAESLYPFENLIDFKNPAVRCALYSGIVVAVSKVAQRIVYDIFYTLMYGLPDTSEIPVMTVYYLSDIIVGIAVYFAVVFLLILFFEKRLKRELYENN